jgi:hypothetical protein
MGSWGLSFLCELPRRGSRFAAKCPRCLKELIILERRRIVAISLSDSLSDIGFQFIFKGFQDVSDGNKLPLGPLFPPSVGQHKALRVCACSEWHRKNAFPFLYERNALPFLTALIRKKSMWIMTRLRIYRPKLHLSVSLLLYTLRNSLWILGMISVLSLLVYHCVRRKNDPKKNGFSSFPPFPRNPEKNPVYARRVDPSALAFSLSSHRHSYTRLLALSLSLNNKRQSYSFKTLTHSILLLSLRLRYVR